MKSNFYTTTTINPLPHTHTHTHTHTHSYTHTWRPIHHPNQQHLSQWQLRHSWNHGPALPPPSSIRRDAHITQPSFLVTSGSCLCFLHWCFSLFQVLLTPELCGGFVCLLLLFLNHHQKYHPLLLLWEIIQNLHTELLSLSGISIMRFPGLLDIFTGSSHYCLKAY